MGRSDVRDWLTLTFLPGLGPTLINRLVDYFGGPGKVLAAGARGARRVEGVGERLARSFDDDKRLSVARRAADHHLELARRRNVTVFSQDDQAFPALLKTIYDPPVILFALGDLGCLRKPAVAIVGSRAATSYGKRVSYELARDLAAMGITVISGMALGIDSEAHKGALAGNGVTAGVLGCGLDVFYPRQNESLYQAAAKSGVLLSEYPLGTRPNGHHFPARNRIISGLSLGVVVVEAAARSGSRITARLALEQGREVFAVPGRVDSGKSAGTHQLLKQGAHLVNNADDIVEELGLALSMRHSSSSQRPPTLVDGLSGEERRVLSLLDCYPITIDEIIRSGDLEPNTAHALLLGLELKGLVRRVEGQRYEKAGG